MDKVERIDIWVIMNEIDKLIQYNHQFVSMPEQHIIEEALREIKNKVSEIN